LEESIAKMLKCPKELIIIQSSQIKSVKEMARDSESEILIKKNTGSEPGHFHEESTVFRAIDEKLKDIIVDVYAPMEYQNNNEKYKKLSELRNPILDILINEDTGA
jgi:hypothetical protein